MGLSFFIFRFAGRRLTLRLIALLRLWFLIFSRFFLLVVCYIPATSFELEAAVGDDPGNFP